MSGRQVVITGASKGIGLAAAMAFARSGCDVHLVARSEQGLRSVADQIVSLYGVRASFSAVDLQADDAASKIVLDCPHADILVNNAGDIPGGTIEDVDEHRWKASWNVKIFSSVALTRAYLKTMKERRFGVIINVIGIAGELLDATYIAGSVGNAALTAFTKAMGAWSPQFGIRVVGLNPGAVATDRLERIHRRAASEQFGTEERWRELASGLPFGRAARADEIAAAMTYLASDEASYISGAILTIDGGTSAGRRIV